MAGEEVRRDGSVGTEEEAVETVAVGWMEALEQQFGSAPWWLVSVVVHMLVLLALGLIVASQPPLPATEVIIPITDFAKIVDPPPVTGPEEPVFTDQRHDLKEPTVDVFTYLPHEDPDIPDDEFMTDSNSEDTSARGQQDAISDIPLGKQGEVGSIGLGGGASGAIGFKGREGRKADAGRRIGPKGPSRETYGTINRALEWLRRHQEPDGHWDGEKFEGKNTDVGITGLALLAFLSDGHSERNGRYRTTVFRGVSWLIKEQQGDGSIGRGYEGGLGYHHAIAGLALAEAFGMGGVKRTGVAAQRAVNYSVREHQNQYSGWRYKAQSDSDLSVTGWFVMQLKSAKVVKLAVDGAAFQGAIAFLDKCTHKDGKYDGLASYKPERGPTPTMTAVGAVSRIFMGWKPNDPLIMGATQNLVEHLPSWDGGNVNFYYWYYGTLAMFQAGGERWKAWNVEMRDTLEQRQRRGAPAVDGSWDPVGAWCGRGGRVYSTAMGALCLEVYYRYLPIYR
jgi:hypothetical protein